MSGFRMRAAQRSGDAPLTPRSPGGWDARLAALAEDAANGGASDRGTTTEDAPVSSAPPHPVSSGSASGVPSFSDQGPGTGDGGVAAARKALPRRGPADPVRALMHRHRELCERAVDALEIAAGLEAHGVTDRTAARFRHRDVFSLAEELYARVPRAEATGPAPRPPAPAAPPARWARAAVHLLPGALAGATVTAVAAVQGGPPLVRPVFALVGAVCVVLALRLCLRGGPLRSRYRVGRTATVLTCWLTGYALIGDRLLGRLLTGGPDLAAVRRFADRPSAAAFLGADPRPVAATAVALCCAVPVAAWCARRFTVRARRGLAASRGLGEFAARVRPLLLTATVLFLCGTVALLAAARTAVGAPGGAAGALASATALAVLLFLARLLAVHGFPAAAGTGLAAAGLAEAAALASLPAARLPGLDVVARPVRSAVDLLGPAVVPTTACTVVALCLLGYGLRVLTGASAHSPALAEQRALSSADRAATADHYAPATADHYAYTAVDHHGAEAADHVAALSDDPGDGTVADSVAPGAAAS